jgi:hypothetical protein
MTYKRDMELLEQMQHSFDMNSDISVYSLQAQLMNNYMNTVTNYSSRNIDPSNLLDEYFDAQSIIRERLQLWNISEKNILHDNLWRGLVVNFIVYFLEARGLE